MTAHDTGLCATCPEPSIAWCPGCSRELCDYCWGPGALICSRCRINELDPDRAWKQYAACAGMDTALFFPERGEPTSQAKAVCRACPVREQCLEHALAAGEHFGIWGGLSERERRPIRRRRRAA